MSDVLAVDGITWEQPPSNPDFQNPLTLCLTGLCAEVLVLRNLSNLLQFLDLCLKNKKSFQGIQQAA